ncbi:MAG: riboflavin biosynthesis protein RibF [Paludibacteraceae bacterium]|nr:riboflavin biosynthesis protein RibF [Paludibacteraceae bacterium]
MAYSATIGFFDGVHIGHRYLIDQLLQTAQTNGTSSAIITFATHPRLLTKGEQPPLLTTYDERIELLRQTGVKQIFCFDFAVVKDMTAKEFMQVLVSQCQVTTLLMGYDHRFGASGHSGCLEHSNISSGHFDQYQQLGAEVGLEVLQVGQSPQGAVSSTQIRRALEEGRIAQANEMLGYAYSLSGEVVHGRHIGTDLGFPTANIQVAKEKLLPKHGVYIGRLINVNANDNVNANVNGASEHSDIRVLVNIGTNPTFGKNETTVEVHIPKLCKDLYGEHLTVELTTFVRDEQRFDSPEALQAQIQKDLAYLRTIS